MRRPIGEQELDTNASPPTMWTLNGCGTMLYGRRDVDPTNQSYVKTLFFTLVFFPVFAISAYRVIDAPGRGWYFQGKTRLSGLARNWNYLMLTAIATFAGVVSWQSHINSPTYLAQQKLEQAAALEAKGVTSAAAKLYIRLLKEDPPEAEGAEARQKLLQLICDRGKELSAEDQQSLLRNGYKLITDRTPRNRILATGMEWVQLQREQGNPCTALELFEFVATKDKAQAENVALREAILRECTASGRGQLHHVDALALILEAKGDTAGLEALLVPRAGNLKASESARILGDIYFGKGELSKAEAVLTPYVNSKLEAFRKAEEGYKGACDRADKAALRRLRNGEAGDSWYDLYDRSNEQKKQAMVDQYIGAAMRRDRGVTKALAALEQEAKIVPFVMDLAVAKLQLARDKESPTDRETTLKEAEGLFLAIQGVAGEDESFRIALGQVKYWLGKSEEGKELFDQVLAQGERRPGLLSTVAEVMRQVGREEEARRLAEEAYEKGNKEEKFAAASMRAVLFRDTDDRIYWLERADTDSPSIRASLLSAKANKAEAEGKLGEAEKSLVEADRLYQSMVVDSASLNNRALVQMQLFALTGATKYLDSHITMLEQSETLNPTHTVIKYNLASAYPGRIASRLIADRIDYRLLHASPELGHLALLVTSQTEEDKLLASPTVSEDIRKLREEGEKLQMLAPESTTGFSTALFLCSYLNDVDYCHRLTAALAGFKGEPKREDTAQEKALYRADALAANGKRLAVLRETLEKDGGTASPMTQALLRCEIADLLESGFGLGAEADGEEIVRLANEAYTIHPSLYTETALRNAHCFVALQSLVKQNTHAAGAWQKLRDAVDTEDACLWLLSSDTSCRQALLADPHFRQMAELYRTAAARGPREQGARGWLALSAIRSPLAEQVAKTVENDEYSTLLNEAYLRLSPHGASVQMYRVWQAQATNHADEAKQFLDEARKNGIDL